MPDSNADIARALGVPPSRVSEWLKRGMPKEVERARVWRMNHAPPRKRAPQASEAPAAPQIVSHDTSWDARLQRAREVELAIFNSMKAKIGTSDIATLQKLQHSHLSAIREIAEAEKVAAEAQVVTGDLVPAVRVRDLLRQILAPLRDALDRLPLGERANCNPDHPEIAEAALATWRDRLLTRASALEAKL